ncbi:uncharacterized protein SETTUDRAFT_30578 [Exserohilum turcica Et28A]|uniref:Uncharacterized protein n=1 Tax=Exserohilum turcicum (strain 28A) TaxID=671987 RepID=R0KWN3_EXST2|nr:uncharacterized protein SETTUDRAFT_30578 [Exserohilum turcica Et28A]EOA92102.1 hypothetical protein SETTUDRAFT_30578 [Exserohilum turcica Et28A]
MLKTLQMVILFMASFLAPTTAAPPHKCGYGWGVKACLNSDGSLCCHQEEWLDCPSICSGTSDCVYGASTDNVWLNFRMGLEMVAGYSEKSFILGLAGIGGHLCVVNSAG